MNAVIARTEAAPEASAIIAVIERAALNPSVDIDKMERLLQMQERIMDRNARAAYAAALAQMQPELPIIAERGGIKDRSGSVQSRYALWEDVVGIITPILSKYGFALSFRTGNEGDKVSVTGVLSHRDGHSELTSLTLPVDTSGSKNAVQSVGSSTSYGKRYTTAALLNLRTGEPDDDGRDGGYQRIDASQVADLRALIQEVGADLPRLLQFWKIDKLEDINVTAYKDVVASVERKRRR